MSRGSLSAKQLEEKCALDFAVVVHESVDSTNSWLLQQAKQGEKLPLACFAEKQTQGRGRRGKQWLMPARSNIAMSLAWPFAADPLPFHLLPLNIALAVVEVLEAAGMKQVQVKWPNDVYVRGRKIAGILIETLNRRDRRLAVIGIGLNYDMSPLEENNLPPFTDVCTELEAAIERNALAAELLSQVVRACEVFPQQACRQLERFSVDYDFCKNKTVEIVTDNHEIVSGVARGVNHLAELVVDVNGEQRVFNSADVSVKQVE